MPVNTSRPLLCPSIRDAEEHSGRGKSHHFWCVKYTPNAIRIVPLSPVISRARAGKNFVFSCGQRAAMNPKRIAPYKKPPLRIQPTTLWDYPSQHYGEGFQGDPKYKGATPSYIV